MTLQPAHGRDYKSKAEILRDLASGKDFRLADIMSGGGYANYQDLIQSGQREVNVRYQRDRKVAVIKLSEATRLRSMLPADEIVG